MDRSNRFLPALGLVTVALTALAGCLDEGPGLDERDVPVDPDAEIDGYPASAETRAATGVARWHQVDCAAPEATTCFDGVDDAGARRAGVAVHAAAGAPLTLALDGLETATVTLDDSSETPLHEQAAAQGHPVALGYLRDVAARPVPARAPSLAAARPATERWWLTCMLEFAQDTYQSATADHCAHTRIGRTADGRAKIWVRETTYSIQLVLGFRGTANLADWAQDWKAKQAVPFTGALYYQYLVKVPWGFLERWQVMARSTIRPNANLGQTLTSYAQRAKASRRSLFVSVVGHSLGAAVSTLAGYDIAHYLHYRIGGLGYRVSVFGFNSPRTSHGSGTATLRARYTQAIRPAGLNLRLHLFQRHLDPVGLLPPPQLGFQHAIQENTRSPNQVSRVIDGVDVGYCPYYIGNRRSLLNPAANHDLGSWRGEIAGMSDAFVTCASAFGWDE